MRRRGSLRQYARTNHNLQICRCTRCLQPSPLKTAADAGSKTDALRNFDFAPNERLPYIRVDKNRRSLSSADTCVDFCLKGPPTCGFDDDGNEIENPNFLDDFTEKEELMYDMEEEKRCSYQTTLWDMIRNAIEDQLAGWSLLEMPKNKVQLTGWSLLDVPKPKRDRSLRTVDDFFYA